MKKHGLLLSFLFTMFLISPLPLAAQIQTGIEGYVYLDSEATPAEGIVIDVHDAHDFYTFLGRTTTNAAGYYAIKLEACGDCYKVHYNTGASSVEYSNYISVWNEGKQTHAEADSISVQSGNRTSLANAILTEGKKISGTVKKEDASPVSKINVSVFYCDENENCELKKNAITDSSGEYSVKGLPSGKYKVFFNALNSLENLISVWYNDALNKEDAELVNLEIVEEVLNINATLATGGTISGTVRNQYGLVKDAWIDVYDNDTNWRGYASTTDGTYTVKGLPDIELKVQFFERTYQNEGAGKQLWYNQTKNVAEATPINVNSTGIDALFEPSKASKLLPAYQQLLLTP
jgi:hypothetical protein